MRIENREAIKEKKSPFDALKERNFVSICLFCFFFVLEKGNARVGEVFNDHQVACPQENARREKCDKAERHGKRAKAIQMHVLRRIEPLTKRDSPLVSGEEKRRDERARKTS